MILPPPLLTYGVPCHNDGIYLPEALKSIERDIEVSGIKTSSCRLVILNDGSTDTTSDEIEKYTKQASLPVLTSYNQLPSGEGGARAKILNLCNETRADFYRFIDADDLIVPDSTNKMICEAKDKNTIGDSGQHVLFGDVVSGPIIFPLSDDEIRNNFRHKNTFPTAYALLNGQKTRESAISVDAKWKITADYALFLSLLKNGNLANLDEPVALYRKHTGSITSNGMNRVLRTFIKISISEWFSEDLPPPSLKDYAGISKIAFLTCIPQKYYPALGKLKQSLKDAIPSV